MTKSHSMVTISWKTWERRVMLPEMRFILSTFFCICGAFWNCTWAISSFLLFHFHRLLIISLQINGSKSVMSTTSYHVRLEERTLFEGYCSLQYGPESSWITRFQFSLSNDGNRYSENYSVYVYDSNCQTFHNDSGDIYFTLQVSQKLFYDSVF